MKDLVSKVTFGFLMAQLVPGTIVVISVSIFLSVFSLDDIGWISIAISETSLWWFSETLHILLFIALSIGAGMLIHGLHWAVLASHDHSRCRPIVSYCPDAYAWVHLLLGPGFILVEVIKLFAVKLNNLGTNENVVNIPSDKMEAFKFLQDFYLYFSQFYAHTAYSLFISTSLAIILTINFGALTTYWSLLIFLYLMTGIFYLLGRIQMLTLFQSERQLCEEQENSVDKTQKDLPTTDVSIVLMSETDVTKSVDLITRAMDENEARWAKEAFDFYFKCNTQSDIDSSRWYYVYKNNDEVTGVVGLHRYRWGPEENAWLSWFAVNPKHQRKGIGSALIKQVEGKAKGNGFKKIFVETYDSKTFKKACKFYKKTGFCEVGRIDDYLPDGSNMIVFCKSI